MPRRRLRPAEVREAETVFGASLAYGDVWVHEQAVWPNTLAKVAAMLSGRQPPPAGNSVTLGNSIYFPHPLRTGDSDLEARIFGDMAWLLHELTHVWQYHHGGLGYIASAAWKHVRLGPSAYDYGGGQGLVKAAAKRASFNDFNPEQQGDIVRDFYLRRKMGLDTTSWQPFMAELQAG
jgi:hypothetical protein